MTRLKVEPDEVLLECLDELFTMNFTVTRDLRIQQPSTALRQYQSVRVNERLHDQFSIKGLSGCPQFEDIERLKGGLVLINSSASRPALRGQFIALPSGSLRFVGFPWLAEDTGSGAHLSAQLSDFPVFDTQLEQNFLLVSQRMMVDDLESLLMELIEARDSVKKASQEMSAFYAVMSHEIRTPLNSVISAVALLKDCDTEAKREYFSETALESANSLLNLINYVLDY